MKNLPLLSMAALALALAVYPCRSFADEEDELNEQPAAVQKTAHEQVGASMITEVEPSFEEGQHATEVEYTENGNKMAVVIAKDGTLIQKEHRMSPGDAPEVIKTAVKSQFAGGKITAIKEVERKDSKFFEVSVHAGGKSHQLTLDSGGKPIKAP